MIDWGAGATCSFCNATTPGGKPRDMPNGMDAEPRRKNKETPKERQGEAMEIVLLVTLILIIAVGSASWAAHYVKSVDESEAEAAADKFVVKVGHRARH